MGWLGDTGSEPEGPGRVLDPPSAVHALTSRPTPYPLPLRFAGGEEAAPAELNGEGGNPGTWAKRIATESLTSSDSAFVPYEIL